MKNEEHKELLSNLMNGDVKALKVKEAMANVLLRSLLLAIIINDGMDDIEILNYNSVKCKLN